MDAISGCDGDEGVKEATLAEREPKSIELGADFSDSGEKAMAWAEVRAAIESAETFWISTVRPDQRPHVTPLIAVWHDGALYFCTAMPERKARNIAENGNVVLTTGNGPWKSGLDVVVEGRAVEVSDDALLEMLAALWESKYDWKWTVRDGHFIQDTGNVATVYEVAPKTVFGFRKGKYNQTRYGF